MNKTILIVVIVLVVGVLGYFVIKHSSRLSRMTGQTASNTSITYQNNTTPNNSTTSSNTSAPTDLSKTNLDSNLKGLDNQAAGIEVNSDDLNF